MGCFLYQIPFELKIISSVWQKHVIMIHMEQITLRHLFLTVFEKTNLKIGNILPLLIRPI